MEATKRSALAAWMLLGAGLLVSAQGTIWHFGDGAGLDFSSGAPVAIGGGASYSLDNSTTVTDNAGSLLFYSNGESVWDATHNVMPNGSGLLGDLDAGQCALAVHRPGTDIFYLFTVDNWNGVNGLRYSVVDMDLNGGLGDVTLKNQMLHTPSTERLEAVRHPSDGSWWLISHDWGNSDFRAYHINTNGLNTAPVISSVGSSHSGNSYDSAGQLSASPDGTMLCCGIYTQNKFQVFDFDATTGIVSNARNLTGYTNAWGCAFSPSSQRLYLTKWYDNEVWQVDLSAGSWSQVQGSAVLVGTTSANYSGWQAGYLQLAPDNKVYMATFGENSIARIASPDALGVACGFTDAAVGLGAGICKAGLCRTATSDVCALSVALPILSGCAWSPLQIQALVNGIPMSWSWDFGDGTTSTLPAPLMHTYFAQGVYIVTVSVSDASGNCVDNAQAAALVGAPETAGADTSITLCASDPPLNLFALLSPYADGNGSWLDQAGAAVPSSFDPMIQSSTILVYAIYGVHSGPDTATVSITVEECNAIGESADPAHMVLFPNPCDDQVTIVLPSDSRDWSIAILDTHGRNIRAISSRGNHVVEFDLEGISAGAYVMRFTSSAGRSRPIPLVKLH
ncbi:MAG: PKD domain-containing protein [Flavobacteriales bacterium]|nr:PKD domain-containing protein [Flavobacteriales bacterium]